MAAIRCSRAASSPLAPVTARLRSRPTVDSSRAPEPDATARSYAAAACAQTRSRSRRTGTVADLIGLAEDVGFQATQPRARIDSELFQEQAAGSAQHRQRLTLASRAVQGKRQQPPRLLPPRMLGHVGVEIRYDVGGTPDSQSRLGPLLDRVQP